MYYRQPRYFSGFHCISGDCPDNCCYGWRIDFTKEEVNKLKSAKNASAELKELIEKTFVLNADLESKYMVQFDERGKCPLVTDDGFCRIQRELGVEYMSHTCMVYPRRYTVTDNYCYRYCNMSCREVMRSLLNDEKSTDLINVPIKRKVHIKEAVINTPEKLQKHPELKYRGELLEFFYEVISDKKRSVEDSIILGALAAQSLTKLVENKEYDRIPEALKTFKKQFHNPEALRKIAGIKPNYLTKFGLLSVALSKIMPQNYLISLLDKTKTLNIDLYLTGERSLLQTYKDRPFFSRNIALNLLLELALPFKLEDKTIFENYSIFTAAFAMFKLNAIATATLIKRAENSNRDVQHEPDWYLIKTAAHISRNICHTENNLKNILELLKEYKMTSPAYLALLVK